jgi:4,4'-diaponeurosporenoate glycosyltransferase
MITIVVCIGGWLCGWWLFGRPRRVVPSTTQARSDAGAPLATCVVVIPARDEALVLGGLLGDLAGSVADGLRVIVVDDHSSDGTAELAAGFDGVEVVSAGELPAGWTGKCWACHRGVQHLEQHGGPDPETLVFLDADVRLDPGVLASLVRRRAEQGGLVSVQPWHATVRPVEQLSALFNLLAVMGTAMGSRHAATGAFGPVLVTTPEDYRRSGGHAAVHSEVVEDMALAQSYRRAGLDVTLLLGGPELRFRMYPTGLAALVEGWTKNFATGAAATERRRLAGSVLWIAALGSAVVVAAQALAGARPLWLGLGIYLAFVVQLWSMLRRVGRFGPLTALAAPVLLLTFLAVFARSVWLSVVRRRVQWRGRSIPVGSRRP